MKAPVHFSEISCTIVSYCMLECFPFYESSSSFRYLSAKIVSVGEFGILKTHFYFKVAKNISKNILNKLSRQKKNLNKNILRLFRVKQEFFSYREDTQIYFLLQYNVKKYINLVHKYRPSLQNGLDQLIVTL